MIFPFDAIPVARGFAAAALPRAEPSGGGGATRGGPSGPRAGYRYRPGAVSVQPFDYIAHPAFALELWLIAGATTNAALLRCTVGWRAILDGALRVSPQAGAAAALAPLAWAGAVVGRMLAF